MRHSLATLRAQIGEGLGLVFMGPQALAFVPAGVLAGFWLWGEPALIMMAVGLPVLLLVLRRVAGPARPDLAGVADGKASLFPHLDQAVQKARRKSLRCGCIAIALDEFDTLSDRHGPSAVDQITDRCHERIVSVLRGNDRVFRRDGARFAIALAPVRHLDADVSQRIARRVQAALEEPVSLDRTTIHVSASLGVALNSQLERPTGRDLYASAEMALRDAIRHGPSALRVYRPGLVVPRPPPHALQDEAVAALENGQIQPWFQPQISTDTGRIAGFEALARWMHPDRGVILPTEFLPLLEQAGKMERLSEVVLYHALHALKSWDMAGLDIPRVGVNFSTDELRNPRLLERIEWDLDRFDLTPGRLMVEILETVVSTSSDDIVSRNINGLAAIGCLIDLDDFGTGHASISAICRYAVSRLKIDRSFVMKVDRDPEQQRMISAILTLAEQLGLETLAEGVETAGEHAMLAQLGCTYVQGFGIAHPLPFDKTLEWAKAHTGRIVPPPDIGRKTG